MRLLTYIAGFGGGKATRGSRQFLLCMGVLAFAAGLQYREREFSIPNAAAGPFLPGALKMRRWPHGAGQRGGAKGPTPVSDIHLTLKPALCYPPSPPYDPPGFRQL